MRSTFLRESSIASAVMNQRNGIEYIDCADKMPSKDFQKKLIKHQLIRIDDGKDRNVVGHCYPCVRYVMY